MIINALIPARGGSKGIPRKNIKLIAGKNLIYYSIKAADSSKYINNIFVSTDDSKIESISKKYGAKIIKRPAKLSRDESLTMDAILHTLNLFEEKNINTDIIVLLQPTSPMRNFKDIDNAIEMFIKNDCESVISVSECDCSPFWSLEKKNDYLTPKFGKKYLKMRRQDLPKLYIPNGAIFVSYPEHLKKFRSFYEGKVLPYLMPPERSIDIDTELDFKIAEVLMKERLNE